MCLNCTCPSSPYTPIVATMQNPKHYSSPPLRKFFCMVFFLLPAFNFQLFLSCPWASLLCFFPLFFLFSTVNSGNKVLRIFFSRDNLARYLGFFVGIVAQIRPGQEPALMFEFFRGFYNFFNRLFLFKAVNSRTLLIDTVNWRYSGKVSRCEKSVSSRG